MADQSDVEEALAALISAALYPAGANAGSAIGSVCRIYRGWPNAAALDADLAAGRVNVTVFPVEASARNTTRWALEWSVTPASPTLSAAVNGLTASFTGSAGTGQLAGLLVDANSYVYRAQPGDTPALVAAALAALVRVDRIAGLAGGSVTVPGAARLVARVVADATGVQEVRRQEQGFRVTAWCNAPDIRDATCTLIDAALAGITFLALPDGSAGRLRYRGTATMDQSQDAALYRRDLIYTVEYPTTLASLLPAMLFADLGLNGQTTLA